MSTDTAITEKNRLEDLIAKLLKGERDPEAARKSRERMDVMREATRRRVGTVEVAVDFIRELSRPMSLFVLDSSIAVKWVLPEPGSDEALALQDAVRHNLHEIIAPDVFASEGAHVLTKAEPKKIISVGDVTFLDGSRWLPPGP